MEHATADDRKSVKARYPSTYLTIVIEFLHNLWLFTNSDFCTFVLPNTVFGMSTAVSEHFLAGAIQHRYIYHTLRRLPLVLLFNWSNLLIFDLANQRLPDAIEEDKINKPYRPLPSGKITQRQTRHLMIIAMPLVLLMNSVLGVWKETALLFSLTWIYNDLRGGEDSWLIRNLIIAFAFFLYNLGSLKVASGASDQAEDVHDVATYGWTALISAVILTTMQVQDLKDQQGDRVRGRQTAPLVLGEATARWTIAVPIIFWSIFFSVLWGSWLLPMPFGLYIAYRILWIREKGADRRSWKLWCMWTVLIYLLPLASSILGSTSLRSKQNL